VNTKRDEKIFTFGRELGWDLSKHVKTDLPEFDELIWYDCGSVEDLLFQINTVSTLRGCVFNLPNRICTCWFELRIDKLLDSDLNFFRDIWDKSLFLTTVSIDSYKKRFPQFHGFDLEDIRFRVPNMITQIDERRN